MRDDRSFPNPPFLALLDSLALQTFFSVARTIPSFHHPPPRNKLLVAASPPHRVEPSQPR